MRRNIKGRLVPNISMLVVIALVPVLAACSGSNVVLASDVLSITKELNCVCGTCDEILSECDCEEAVKLTDIVKKGLSRGHSAEQIVQDLVGLYGQRVVVAASHT
ncbi:cytochrome c-type biogenesis protein CcmH [Chloroflexota bacterium]